MVCVAPRPGTAPAVTRRARITLARRRPRRRLSPLRLRTGDRAAPVRLGAELAARRAGGSGGRAGGPGGVPHSARARQAAACLLHQPRTRVAGCDGSSRLRDPPQRSGRRAAGAGAPGHRHLRRLPARGVRSGRPASPLPLHQLHSLRAALLHHRSPALRPRTHFDEDLPDVRRVPGRVRRPGRSPLPRPAQCLPRLRSPARAVGTRWQRHGDPPRGARRRRGGARRGTHRRGEGAGRLPSHGGRAPRDCRAAPARAQAARGEAARTPLPLAGGGCRSVRGLPRRGTIAAGPRIPHRAAAARASQPARSPRRSPRTTRIWARCSPTRRCTGS